MSDTEGRDIWNEDRREDRGEGREQTKWEMVVELIQTAFWEGVIAEEVTWQTVVLIPKGGGGYYVIGLV